MRIDRTHKPWATMAAILLIVSLIIYVWYASTKPGGPRGGTFWGLAFGIAGYALMLYVGLLGVRKKLPVWRLGKAQTWMRGHIWMGLITLPLILLHAGGFHARGPLTLALMVLFYIVWLSGIFGAALQHYLPTMITAEVPLETIYEEIPHVRAQLRDEAEELVAAIASDEVEQDDKARLRDAYAVTIRPFLNAPEQPGVALADEQKSEIVFDSLRRSLPEGLRGALDDLENICEEERQFTRQKQIYQWLHAWLIVHVPLSVALLVLGGVHAVIALRY
jgi:hypothetical protein